MKLIPRIAVILLAALIVTGATMLLTPANSASDFGAGGQRPPRPEGAPPRGERGGPGGFAFGEVLSHSAVIAIVVAPFAVYSATRGKRRRG
jgi:hypothetical protein